MNRRPDLPLSLVSIDLAREQDFTVGGLNVSPSRLQVAGNGAEETVQPRVMQVLVALFRARGTVVSREDLIESCWDGIVVGEDSISRCIAKIRQLSDAGDARHFEIKTIPRVGYRLIAETTAADVAIEQTAELAPPISALDLPVLSKFTGLGVRHWIGLAVLCALLVAGALTWRLLAVRASPSWTVVESHQPFIGTSQIERYPALSPDGTMLAYSAGPNIADRQIFLRIIRGDSSIQLTHETYDAMSPAWSPDGATIAYSVFQSGKPCRIMEMQIPSGQPYQVGRCRTAERAYLTFDPSGHALVFNDSVASETPDRLFRLDTETGRVGPLTIPPKTILGDNSPSFSPDGRFLVYSRDINGARGEIRLRTMNDGRERVVTSLNQWDCGTSPAWTPDGAAILMSGDCEGNSLLRIYPLDGGTPSQIVPGGNSVGRLSVSANGYVAMETGGGHAQLLAFKPGSGQTPSPLDERSGLTAWCVDFAPDGALAITGRKGAARGVWVAERESAQFRKLMSLPDQACLIRWSPDGTLLSFVQARSDGFEVPIVNRSGEILKRFHFSDKDSGLIAWASDGKSIFSSRLATEGWRIWRTDLSTLKSDPVTAFGWLNPAVHGTMLFAEKADTAGIWRIDNGKPTRVTDGPIPESQYFFAISGDQIYYADKSDRKHPAISAESVYGGPKKRLMDLPFGFTGYTMGINPKFGDIVFSLSGAEDTDIALIRLVRR